MAAASFPFILVSVYTCDALPALQLLIDLCHVDLYTYIRKYIWIYKEILYNLAFGPPQLHEDFRDSGRTENSWTFLSL